MEDCFYPRLSLRCPRSQSSPAVYPAWHEQLRHWRFREQVFSVRASLQGNAKGLIRLGDKFEHNAHVYVVRFRRRLYSCRVTISFASFSISWTWRSFIVFVLI